MTLTFGLRTLRIQPTAEPLNLCSAWLLKPRPFLSSHVWGLPPLTAARLRVLSVYAQGKAFTTVWEERQLLKLQLLTRQLLAENGISSDDVIVAFRQFDEDGSGLIEAIEFSRFISDVLGLSLERTELNMLWSMLDINGSGAINYVEFHSMLFPKTHLDEALVGDTSLAAAAHEQENEAEQACAARLSHLRIPLAKRLGGAVSVSAAQLSAHDTMDEDNGAKGLGRSLRRRRPSCSPAGPNTAAARKTSRGSKGHGVDEVPARRSSPSTSPQGWRARRSNSTRDPRGRSKHHVLRGDLSNLQAAHEATDRRLDALEVMLRELHEKVVGSQHDSMQPSEDGYGQSDAGRGVVDDVTLTA